MSKKVDINFVIRLQKIFSEKKWSEKENWDYVFESLCNLSEYLGKEKEEYELFLNLIEKYNWMSLTDYSKNINSLLFSIFTDEKISIKKIYAFPIIKPEDEEKNKSGNSISYMMKCNKPYLKIGKHIIYDEITQFDVIKNLHLKDGEYLLLVDDYIGSGETLHACIQEIITHNSSLENSILIASIAVQHDTIPKIKYPLFYNLEVKKGITDNYHSPAKEKYIDTMIKIEQKLISGRNFSLGYEQSEGLITMMRTPDNTFPIFWHDYRKQIDLYPPFPRN